MNKRLLSILATMAAALIVTGVIAWVQFRPGSPSPVIAENFGGPFTLTNQHGKVISDKDVNDSWRLIYFGFTYCPSICPTELAKITKALGILGYDGQYVIPVFITVDPERDTPQVLDKYLSSFHPNFVG